VYQFCCGTAFALVTLKSGSILPTALAHFFNNAAILVLTKLGISQFPTPVFIVVVVVSAVCLVGSLAYLLFADKNSEIIQKSEKSDINDRKTFLLCAVAGIFICAVSWISVFVAGL
jgi:hypothetical protein